MPLHTVAVWSGFLWCKVEKSNEKNFVKAKVICTS